jgi:hypothetical protein
MFTCSVCRKPIEPPANTCTTGYGLDRRHRKVCYTCCGERDKADMRQTGRATLYLTKKDKEMFVAPNLKGKLPVWTLTNWPGTLSIEPFNIRFGRHNIAGQRYDVWFNFEGKTWHGVRYGDNTELCHCRRTA